MSKLLFALPLLAIGATASAQNGAWVASDPCAYSATGVTNEGLVVVAGDQNTARYLWNPFTDEYTYIGGISAGNGVGGLGRISEDGRFVVSTAEFDRIEVSNKWTVNDFSEITGDVNINKFGFIPFSVNQFFAFGGNADNSKGWILTTGNGQTWKANDVYAPAEGFGAIACMGFRTIRRGHAAGYGGCFYTTTNQGVSWYAEDPHPEGNTDEVYCYRVMDFTMDKPGASGMPLAGILGVELADHTGTVWYTENFTHYNVAEGVKGVPMAVAHINTVYFIATDNGYIQKSEDNGKTWTTVLQPQAGPSPWSTDNASFRAIRFASDNERGVAVGSAGIYVTDDAGETWVKVTAPAIADWKCVSINANDEVAILGANKIFTSADFCESWEAVSMAGANDIEINDVYYTNDYIAAAANNGKTLYRSNSQYVAGKCAGIYDMETEEWTALPITGYFSGGIASNPNYITGNGSIVVGHVYDSETIDGVTYAGSKPAVWRDGELTLLPNKFFYGEDRPRSAVACAASFDGDVVVGWQDYAGPWMASVWRRNADGTYTQRIMTKDPNISEDDILFDGTMDGYNDRSEKVLGQANAVSPDGKIIGGQGYDEYFASSGAWLWSEEKGYRELTPDGYMVYDMNSDGTVVVGQYRMGGGAWIWTEERGMMSLSDYLAERGIYPESGVAGVMDMSPNGRFVCGYGYTGSGVDMRPTAYVADLFADYSGVEKMEAQTKVTVYPNPVADELHIDLPFAEVKTSLTLYNMQGAPVMTISDASTSNVMNVSALEQGMYLLVTDAQGMKKATKVIVSH